MLYLTIFGPKPTSGLNRMSSSLFSWSWGNLPMKLTKPAQRERSKGTGEDTYTLYHILCDRHSVTVT